MLLSPMVLATAFVIVSLGLLYFTRGSVRRPGSHGFYRFFAWECILGLVWLKLPAWGADLLAPHHLLAQVLLVTSVWLPLHAFRLLTPLGHPGEMRNDDALVGFEKTSKLVTVCVHCGSFSKCLAPGYRVGWVAGGRFAAKIEQMRLMYTLSPAIPSEAAIAAYLDGGGYDRHLRRMRAALAHYSVIAIKAVQTYFPAGTRLSVPQRGYFLWLELPESVDTIKLHALARECGISLAPGPLFSTHRRFRCCLRLNFDHGGDPRFEPAIKSVGQLATGLMQG